MFSIGFLTLDILIILAIFIVSFFVAFQSGKKQIVKIVLSVYPAILIYTNLPIQTSESLMQILIFLGVYVVTYLIMKKNFTSTSNNDGFRRFMDSFLVSIAAVFTLLIIYYRIIPLESLYQLNLPFSGFLVNSIPFYATLIVPIIAILFTNKKDY